MSLWSDNMSICRLGDEHIHVGSYKRSLGIIKWRRIPPLLWYNWVRLSISIQGHQALGWWFNSTRGWLRKMQFISLNDVTELLLGSLCGIGFDDNTDLLWWNNINNKFCRLTTRVWHQRRIRSPYKCIGNHTYWGLKSNWGIQSKNGFESFIREYRVLHSRLMNWMSSSIK